MSNWSNTLRGPILIATGSVTGSSTGAAMLFAKTDGKLYVKNTSGSVAELGASSGTNPIIREYIANATWTKPTGLFSVLVVCVGAGAGGGSGARGNADAVTGGGGGSGAAIVYRYIRAGQLSSTATITIGAGGAGGAPIAVNDTPGNAGSNGGNTTFVSGGTTFVLAKGGGGGYGGDTNYGSGYQGIGGFATDCTPAYGPFALNGARGGEASPYTAPDGNLGLTGGDEYTTGKGAGCPGGGSGGSSPAFTQGYGGGNGGGIYVNGTQTIDYNAGNTGGNRNGGVGVARAGNILFDVEVKVTNGNGIGTGGGGGAGGDGNATIAGGNGGAGVNGSGGGGGGSSVNPRLSGAGGAGGNGICFVVEFYGV